MPKINEYISSYTLKDYSGHLPGGVIDLDCTLGVNPEALPESVMEALKTINAGAVKYYPHDDNFIEKLAAWFRERGIAWLTKENLALGDGSVDLLFNINLLCLAKDKKVLGHAPQFTAYVDHVNCIGAAYRAYRFPQADNYRFSAEGYLAEMDSSCSLFIVENPNNPTGQIIKRGDIEKIAAKAMSLDTVLIVDEAYGDYMEFDNSALHIIKDYPNVIVTRSFSKGFGMAGVRLGYAAASTQSGMLAQLKKLMCPFNCNGVARLLGEAMLESGADVLKTNAIQANKQKVLSALGKLKAAETSLRTPIMTLYYDTNDSEFDLQSFLAEKVRLAAVSCATYDGLDKRAVRLMLPNAADVDGKLLPMLAKAQSLLP
jgi:histidinol-phosphate aminotransferase